MAITAAIFWRLRTMPGVAEQAGDVGVAERRDPVDIEPGEGGAKRRALLQHRQPGQAGLVDLQAQPLEQHRLVLGREAVLGVVIGPVQRWPGAARQ